MFNRKNKEAESAQSKAITKNIEENERKISAMRKIVIGTDGNEIGLISADVSGALELVAVLKNIIAGIEQGVIRIVPRDTAREIKIEQESDKKKPKEG